MAGSNRVLDTILIWPPIVWVSRILTLFVVGLALVLGLATTVRLLRPSSLLAIVRGDVPSVKGFRGKLRVLGQEFEANAELDSRRDAQLLALETRIAHLEQLSRQQGRALERLLSGDQEEQ